MNNIFRRVEIQGGEANRLNMRILLDVVDPEERYIVEMSMEGYRERTILLEKVRIVLNF